MAKKKENELTYLQLPLPRGRGGYKITKLDWSGFNRVQEMNSGALVEESNISTAAVPYLTPSQKRTVYRSGYARPIGLFGFDDFLLVVYRDGGAVKIDYIRKSGSSYTGTLKASGASAEDETPRSIVQFNVYDAPSDPVAGKYVKKLLIFPDKKSIDFTITSNFTPADLVDGLAQMPDIKYATVHLSRIFGVDDERVYASGFNDYANWALDTADEYNESNAWCSPAQSNVKANGAFTGITTFQNHVVCFKRDFMHEIYNTKNPFRIQDIFGEGCIDNRTILDVDGKLIFVSQDHVKIYTGSNPRIISYPLGTGQIKEAVAGTDGRCYYLFCKTQRDARALFVYDTYVEQWSQQDITFDVVSFARNQNGLYAFGSDGNVYRLDSGRYDHAWRFTTDFETLASSANQTLDIKHIRKIQIYGEFSADSWLECFLLYDGEAFDESRSQKVCSIYGRTGKIPIRILPRKTAHYGYQLYVRGFGYVKLYELEVFLTPGGELYRE